MELLTTLSKTILTGALIAASAITSLVGINKPQETTTLGAYYTAAGGTYRLQTSIGSTDTTIRLSSFKDPRSESPITMAYLNTSVAYGTLDPQQPGRSELISFTGVTQNSDGTASLTGVTRGLQGVYPYTASSTLRKTHAGQSIFILSDAPQVFNEYSAKRNDETITGAWTFGSTTFTGLITTPFISTTTFVGPVTFNSSTTHSGFAYFNASSTFNATTSFNMFVSSNYTCSGDTPLSALCNKAYIDGVATSGAPNASTIQKGVVQEATVGELNAASSTGSTGARLYVNPSTLLSSTIISSQFATTSTIIPIPVGAVNNVTASFGLSSSTKGIVGLVTIPQKITANSISIVPDNTITAGVVTISLYDVSGSNRLFTASTTISGGANNNRKIALNSAASIPAGMYYIVVYTDDVYSGGLFTWAQINNGGYLTGGVGEPKITGRLSATTTPTSFNPSTDISTSSASFNTALYFRLDD